MGNRDDLQSPLKRASFAVMSWFDVLPVDAQMDAKMALERLMEAAKREVEQAYYDGNNQRAEAERRKPFLPKT